MRVYYLNTNQISYLAHNGLFSVEEAQKMYTLSTAKGEGQMRLDLNLTGSIYVKGVPYGESGSDIMAELWMEVGPAVAGEWIAQKCQPLTDWEYSEKKDRCLIS